MYWLLGSKSQLSIENKLLLYKAILKPMARPTVGHNLQLKRRNTTKILHRVYALEDFYKLSNVLLNFTQSDNLQ